MDIGAPGRRHPAIDGLVRRYLTPVVRLCHRPTLEGAERLPEDGPFLLVANHSAGLGVAEILSFVVTYLHSPAGARPIAAFAHPVGFRVFPVSAALRAIGAVPSTYAGAERALGEGVPLLVFPGGDHETLRPFWQANLVDFGGRVGFLKIARAAGVAVVPMGIRGGHMTGPMLFRSRALATLLIGPRLIGQKRWGVSLLGLVGAAMIWALVPWAWPLRLALVWLWLGSALSLWAWIPWTVRLRIGAPIAASELFAREPGDGPDAELARALARVQGAVQALVDR
jgi:1-acyl-sn-glycerol-3-phosphate acyltransferase